MSGNWVKLHRQTMDSEVFQDADAFRVFSWCLMCANYKPTKWRGKDIPAGAFVTGSIRASDMLDLSRAKFRRILGKLRKMGCIETESDKQCTIIRIKNWSSFQDGNDKKQNQKTPKSGHQKETENATNHGANEVSGEESGQQPAINRPSKRPSTGHQSGHQPATDKEGKKLRREEVKNVRREEVNSGCAADADGPSKQAADEDGGELSLMLDWCEWWNELRGEGFVDAGVQVDPPGERTIAAWRKARKRRDLRHVWDERDRIDKEIRRASPFLRTGWFRFAKLLGGKNKDGELIVDKLLDGGYRDDTASRKSTDSRNRRPEDDRRRRESDELSEASAWC